MSVTSWQEIEAPMPGGFLKPSERTDGMMYADLKNATLAFLNAYKIEATGLRSWIARDERVLTDRDQRRCKK